MKKTDFIMIALSGVRDAGRQIQGVAEELLDGDLTASQLEELEGRYKYVQRAMENLRNQIEGGREDEDVNF